MTSIPPSEYIIFLRPEPADGAVRREVVGIGRDRGERPLPTDPIYLPDIGFAKIYCAADLNFDAEFCEELFALWTMCTEYRRTGDCDSEGYSEFLRRFGPACERADAIAHAALTATTH